MAIERENEARQRSESSLQDISINDPDSFTSPRSYSSGEFLITFIEELFTEENAKLSSGTLSKMPRFDSLVS